MTKNNLKVVKSTKDQEMDIKEKNKALDAAISQITDNFGKGSVMKLGEKRAMDIESISTGSLSLDLALGIGGLPKGRIVEVYGPESSGKTTLALQVVAEAQKAGGICAFPPDVVSGLPNITPIFILIWLMKIIIVFVFEIEPVNFLKA